MADEPNDQTETEFVHLVLKKDTYDRILAVLDHSCEQVSFVRNDPNVDALRLTRDKFKGAIEHRQRVGFA